MHETAALHLLRADELRGKRVSPHSTWYDTRWIFDNPTAGQPAAASKFDWDISLPDGSSLMDPQWTSLLDAFRRFIWSLLVDPRHGKHYKPGTLASWQTTVRYFIRWMVDAGYHSLGELDGDAFEQYAESVATQKRTGDDGDEGLSTTLLRPYLHIPVLIIEQAEVLSDAGIEPPKGIPYDGKSAKKKALELAKEIRRSIPPVPDHVFLPTLETALDWLDRRADAIIGLRDVVTDARDKAVGTASPFYNIGKAVRAYVASVPNGKDLFGENAGAGTMLELVDCLRDACGILIQALVGIRVSELCGLEATPVDTATGMPACISMKPSPSGLHQLFFIRGKLFKTEQGWSEQEWIAGSRPVGSDYLPPPVRAAIVLERLMRPWRDVSVSNRLMVTFSETRTDRNQPMAGPTMRVRQRQFLEERVGITDWHVTTHQWRKSFAQYVIRTDTRMLPVLRDHFKHLSIAMTEQGYVASDPELRQILDDAAVQATVRLVADMVSGRKRVEGPLATMLRESAERLAKRLSNRSDEERLDDIEDMVRSSGMRAWEVRSNDTSLGTCLFRPGTGNCTAGSPVRWAMAAPLWSAARPDICWECQNLLVAEDHGLFWLGRLDLNVKALAAAREADEVGLAMLCVQRIAQCKMVLSKIGVDIPGEVDLAA